MRRAREDLEASEGTVDEDDSGFLLMGLLTGEDGVGSEWMAARETEGEDGAAGGVEETEDATKAAAEAVTGDDVVAGVVEAEEGDEVKLLVVV